jgi:hypothetical protein
MFRKLIKNKKAQNTAEYAILISLVVAGIIAMQTYAQRALQARVRDASTYLKNQTTGIGNSAQYEPYYLDSTYSVTNDQSTTETLDVNVTSMAEDTTRTRAVGGSQTSDYTVGTHAGGEQF